MKKNYIKPMTETVVLSVFSNMLAGSGHRVEGTITGGKDDGGNENIGWGGSSDKDPNKDGPSNIWGD